MANPTPIFHPVQNSTKVTSVLEPVALCAYEVYCHLFRAQPAMIDVAKGCRGGFSVAELIAFLYAHAFPREEWQQRVDEALERRSGNAR